MKRCWTWLPQRSGICEKAPGKTPIQIRDNIRGGLVLQQTLIQPMGSPMLKRHVTVVAGTHARGFQSSTGLLVESASWFIYLFGIPRLGVAGLAARGRIKLALYRPACNPICKIQCFPVMRRID